MGEQVAGAHAHRVGVCAVFDTQVSAGQALWHQRLARQPLLQGAALFELHNRYGAAGQIQQLDAIRRLRMADDPGARESDAALIAEHQRQLFGADGLGV
ncbi:hypothetical protein D3C73_902240 [compost metagenome]